MNYTELNTLIKAYMLRNDQNFIDQLPSIIEQGVKKIYYETKDIGFEQTAPNYGITNNTNTAPIPGDWLDTISISYGNIYILPRSYEFVNAYNGAVGSSPKYYCETGYNQYLFSSIPTFQPGQRFDLTLKYFAMPSFDLNNATSFISIKYPSLLLYSCLEKASILTGNEEQRTKYAGLFKEELALTEKLRVSRSTDRSVQREKM